MCRIILMILALAFSAQAFSERYIVGLREDGDKEKIANEGIDGRQVAVIREFASINALLVGSGLLSAGLDQGNTILEPHAAFLATQYAPEAALEPFEYVGARWKLGLAQRPPFVCAPDRGRASIIHLVGELGNATVIPSWRARYFVFSPERRPSLAQALESEGWAVVATIPGRPTFGRAAVARRFHIYPAKAPAKAGFEG